MITDKELKREKDYLKTVLYILEKKIAGNEAFLKENEKRIEEDLKFAWDNKLDDYEWAEIKLNINRKEATSVNTKNRLFAYSRMIKSAYFARIDFDDGEEVLPIYLGIATLEDGASFYVYDWRAPISSMFYDFELGQAYYDTPNGRVTGTITLKRQYKLEGDKIVQIFDTSLQVIDDILKEMLEGHASDKMRNIVTTIQKEQNKIIRKLDSDVLVVSGPAGSGKTSVALHRVAFLLYAYKETLKNSNILILSPNDLFSNYISDVLPEIGEDNVYQSTFADFISAFTTEFKIKGNLSDVYETIYNTASLKKEDRVVLNSIKLKQSGAYFNLIETYLKNVKPHLLKAEDVVYGNKVIIEKAFILKFLEDIEKEGLPFKEQAKKLAEKIMLHIEIKLGKDKAGKTKIKKALMANIEKIKAKDVYLALYKNKENFVKRAIEAYNEIGTPAKNRLSIKDLTDIFDYTEDLLSKNMLPFEDVSGYLYLKDRVLGIKTQQNIKQVVIDEGQDYTAMQYRILSNVFKNAKITVLGDSNQCILPYGGFNNFESVTNLLAEDRVKERCTNAYLGKTYRSTIEINTFARSIIGEKSAFGQIERHGDEVKIIKDTLDFKNSQIKKDAISLKTKENTVAIITKTEAQAKALKQSIAGEKENRLFKLVTKLDKTYVTSSINIIPAYLAKGLEFDVALVYGADENEYPQEFRNLFYVAVTRALHKLNVYYSKSLTKLIKS